MPRHKTNADLSGLSDDDILSEATSRLLSLYIKRGGDEGDPNTSIIIRLKSIDGCSVEFAHQQKFYDWRLDVMNRRLGVKIPSDVFTSCPRCRKSDLLTFEGEVFCLSCNWDSVDIHAEALALAELHRQNRLPVQASASSLKSSLIQRLFQFEGTGKSCNGDCPDAA
jgi:hypothetical protein